MSKVSQTNRELEFMSPLGQDVLLLQKFTAVEELGKPFQFNLQLRSTQEDIDFEALLGQNASIRLATSVSEQRYFNGYITEFSQGQNSEGFSTYTATISPWLWFLGLTQDCRIFQEQTAVDIIEAIFKESGYSDYELRLTNDYREREYTVQYRESDFNFTSRLMEQEGIYYFFKHENGKHTLVLCDSYSSHDIIPAYNQIPYAPEDSTTIRKEEVISFWQHRKRVVTGAVTLNDFDFKNSSASLQNQYSYPREHNKSDLEIYDYPGKYVDLDEGKHYARIRQEEIQTNYSNIEGNSNAREFTAGGLMQMAKHPRQDQNAEYLIIRVTHEFDQDSFGSTKQGGTGFSYKNTFNATESLTPFRSAMRPSPKVDGPQSALVVGPENEEIYCDEFGRVKVQFPWDRYGVRNENSSCWIRVSQTGNWGSVTIPRIGQEVIVDFYEGDPDRPIITGRTYNDTSKVPYTLPQNKTRMTFKSNTHKGKGFNELRFEDEAGQEEVFMHAQKDSNSKVGNNQTNMVGANRTEDIKVDETINIGNNRTESVGNDEIISIGNNRNESVSNNESISIGKDHQLNIGKGQNISIGKSKTESIGIANTLSVAAGMQVSVGIALNTSVGVSSTEQVGGFKQIISGKRIQLVCGASSLTLNSDGTIALKGVKLDLEGTAVVNAKGAVVKLNT